MCTADKSCQIPPSFVNCENRGTGARSASETGRDLARESGPVGYGRAHRGRDRGQRATARDAIKFRAGCARDRHPRRLMKRVRVFCRVGRSCRARASTGGEGCAGIHQTKGGSLEKKARVATLTFNGRRQSRSSRSLLPGVRATFCEVCRSNAMSADDASIVTRPHTWRRVTSLRGAGSILLGGVFFLCGDESEVYDSSKTPRVIPD